MVANEDAHRSITVKGSSIPHLHHSVIAPAEQNIRVHSICKTYRVNLIRVRILNSIYELIDGHIVHEQFGCLGPGQDFFTVTRQLD